MKLNDLKIAPGSNKNFLGKYICDVRRLHVIDKIKI